MGIPYIDRTVLALQLRREPGNSAPGWDDRERGLLGQVITANRLTDGAVVFLDDEGQWSERLDRSQVFPDKVAAATGLDIGKAAEAGNLIVDLYAVDVTVQAGAIMPLKLREVIRARGPTIFAAFTKPGSTPAPVQEDDHVSV